MDDTQEETGAIGSSVAIAKSGSSTEMAVSAGDDDAHFESDVADFAKFLADNNSRMPRLFSRAELDAAEDEEGANNEHKFGCFLRRMRELQKSTSGEATVKLK